MITEQQLKKHCTPDAVKWMTEQAEGFKYFKDAFRPINIISVKFGSVDVWTGEDRLFENSIFPLLIHRAVEGWNKNGGMQIIINRWNVQFCNYKGADIFYSFSEYKSESLTPAECAMLYCLLAIFNEMKRI